MKLWVLLSLVVATVTPAPLYELDPYDYHVDTIFKTSPLLQPPVFPFPEFHSAVLPIKIPPAEVLPIPTLFKLASPHIVSAPTYVKSPVYGPSPIVKTVAPATSYATVTKYEQHQAPVVVKAIVAPQAIFKSIVVTDPVQLDNRFNHYHH